METKTGFENESSLPGNPGSNLEKLGEQYKHINGWGIDADPENEPTYPMKKYNGDDHKRSNYSRPPLQTQDVEVLHSNERPGLSAVFGTVSPPAGLSGAIRRFAFRYSEESLRHWFSLVLADRVNVIEGIFSDFLNGRIPNIIAEKGLQAEWKYNRKKVLKNAVITTLAMAAVLLFWTGKKKYRNWGT
jgi:hypothetical protein